MDASPAPASALLESLQLRFESACSEGANSLDGVGPKYVQRVAACRRWCGHPSPYRSRLITSGHGPRRRGKLERHPRRARCILWDARSRKHRPRELFQTTGRKSPRHRPHRRRTSTVGRAPSSGGASPRHGVRCMPCLVHIRLSSPLQRPVGRDRFRNPTLRDVGKGPQ